MSTIADLLIKIGADSSGLNSELKNAKGQIDKTFEPSPIKGFTDALNGTSASVEGFASKVAKAAALAGAGFGFTQLISGAVEAGSRIHDLTEAMGISAAEASMFSRTVAIAGGDIQTASTALMKLDKTLTGGGTAAEKAQIMLQAVGVSLQDSNGKLLPVNQQLEALAEGYQKAAKAGYQQEFIMNTLGAKGLALAGTLREYAEAKEQASKISGIGLDPEEMDRLSKELTALKMQASSIGLATGAALAPIVEAYLPYIMTGLSNTAKFLAANKDEIVDITRNVVAFIAVYKTLQALQAASRAVGGLFGSAGSTAAEEALTRVQEKAIEKRIKMVQAAALAEEKAYYQSLSTMQATEAEKTAIYAKFVKQRELQAAEEAAAIRNAMTAAYAQVNAAATESAAVQSAAGAKVAGQAAVTSAAIATTGTAATGAAVKTVGAAATSVSAIGTIKSAVWGLIGGWMGVAAAIGYATYKLFEYKRAQFNKEYYQDVVQYNGQDYKKFGDTWKLREVNDSENIALGEGTYKYSEVSDSDLAAVLDNLNEEKKAQSSAPTTTPTTPPTDPNLEQFKKQLEDALAAANAAGSSGNSTKAASTKVVDTTPKQTEVQVPIGQLVAQEAANSVGMSFNTHNLDETLHEGLGGISEGCAQFASYAAKLAGVSGLNSADADDLKDAGVARGAYHYGDFNGAKEGDLLFWGYSGGSIQHVGVNDGNGGHYAYNSNSSGGGPGVVHADSNEDYYNVNGYVPLGYLSMDKFTGGQTTSAMMDDAQKKQQEAIDRLNKAKDDAVRLFSEMSSAIGKESGTAYESGMASVADDVQKKAQEIARLQKEGVPDVTIKALTKELAEYQTTMSDKVEKQRKENLDKLVADTAKANAELKGDYKSLADAEYQSTLDALNKERDERLKAVAKDKNDKEAMAAVEEWYTAQTAAAAQKRADAYRESFDKQVEYAIKAHDMIQLQGVLNSQDGKDSRDWDGRTEAMERYYDMWKAANVSVDEQMTAVAEKAQTGLQDFFTNLFTGENSFTDSILDLFDSIMMEILDQITQKWSAQIVTSLFGGFLNGNNGSKGDGLSIIGDASMAGLFNNFGSIFGGGGSNESGGNSGWISVGGDMGVGSLSTGLSALSTGLNTATTAVTAMGGATGTAGNLVGAYNVVQGVLNMTTKPAESATTVATTASLTALSTAAMSAAMALQTMSVAGGFGFFGFASGGYISGPGTSTSDSIPAMLSNGEYVINADAVSRVGAPLLDAINQGRSIRHFAGGGLVSGSGGSGIILKAGGTVQLNVSALDASSFVDFLRNGGGDTIKQLLLDNDRDYTGNTGVW